jgi:hypothetical protein
MVSKANHVQPTALLLPAFFPGHHVSMRPPPFEFLNQLHCQSHRFATIHLTILHAPRIIGKPASLSGVLDRLEHEVTRLTVAVGRRHRHLMCAHEKLASSAGRFARRAKEWRGPDLPLRVARLLGGSVLRPSSLIPHRLPNGMHSATMMCPSPPLANCPGQL